jgi:hypothetical protein
MIWWRYSNSNLKKDVLFFTSSAEAAETYKNKCLKEGGTYMFKIDGDLNLVSVKEYLQQRGLQPEYNILDENGDRKESTAELAEPERQFYRSLMQHVQEGIDGFYTPASQNHHDEMVLVNKDIIEALRNFNMQTSNGGTPRDSPPQRVGNVLLEKRYMTSWRF